MPRILWIFLIFSLVFAGCKEKETKPDTSPLESPMSQPMGGASPLLSPTAALVSTAAALPQPEAGLGMVTGTLLQRLGGQPSEPMASAFLYLAPLIYSADGEFSMARLNKSSAPKALSDQMGHFLFSDIEPDTYALVYSSVTAEFLVKDPDSDEDLLLAVEAGQLIDLGELVIELP